MNEKIRELVLKATNNNPCLDEFGIILGEEDIEEFFKLIVKECISACSTDRLGKTAGAEDLIKQHFGVE